MTDGLLIHAAPDDLRPLFGLVADLQPLEWHDRGLVCAPALAPDIDPAPIIRQLPLPVEAAAVSISAWPDTTSRWLGGWYLRSEHHAPAPPGIGEILQVDGEGFGPIAHATTAMCLRAMVGMAPAPAVDVGCGSGILSQAWAQLSGQYVLGVDLDPRAVAQANASADLAGLRSRVEFRHLGAHALASADLAGRVVFANMPIAAHHDLADRCRDVSLAGLIASGVRPSAFGELRDAYRGLGLRLCAVAHNAGFVCVRMEPHR